ncbi:MAG: hypothetical protein HXS44_01255 [Theionarchaea archaeon]|nr:hypothetical protein [Theionarchaea archaeon]
MKKALPRIKEIRWIDSIKKNGPDDIFICCANSEERCKGTVERLAPKYKARSVFLLRYENQNSKKTEQHIHEMKEKLEEIGEVLEIYVDERRPLQIISEIVQSMGKHILDPLEQRITIDISAITKWHLLILLKALNLKNLIRNIRILYTEPEDYITDLFQPLSFGIREIFPIPTYYGNYDFSREPLLVLLLGYEGDRALALYEEVDPADCLLLIPKPAYHKEWEGRTEEMNVGIINIVGKTKIEYIHARNPIMVSQQLYGVLSRPEYQTYNHIISPLGTKPQTLGLYSYLSTEPENTILIYGEPLRHNEMFYSTGIGRSWCLPFI